MRPTNQNFPYNLEMFDKHLRIFLVWSFHFCPTETSSHLNLYYYFINYSEWEQSSISKSWSKIFIFSSFSELHPYINWLRSIKRTYKVSVSHYSSPTFFSWHSTSAGRYGSWNKFKTNHCDFSFFTFILQGKAWPTTESV